jgi:hypothetical protein
MVLQWPVDDDQFRTEILRIEERLWPSQRRRLARRWIDLCARELLPLFLDKADRKDQADRLRGLPPIGDDAALPGVLKAVREIVPESLLDMRLDGATLRRSVPRDAFTAPHIATWGATIREPFDPTGSPSATLKLVIEDRAPLWLIAVSTMMLAEDLECAPQTAQKLLDAANVLVSEP